MVRKGVSRFGVSVPIDLLQVFDRQIKRMGCDRSKAIQLAMRNFLTEHAYKTNEKVLTIGTVVLVYDHETKGLDEELTRIQHVNRSIIRSAMHVHLDEKNCLLTIVVNGNAGAIRGFVNEIMSKKGVKQLKIATIMP
ncbi:MAG: nickel-responsive transcriptional regulator NikR [Thermoproteota archaeon]